ncbi:MAG: protein kinase [Erysipelotrichaceae bacterium]|nr:protein kinase [Erysipelotrichaceae bacterium]
MNKTIGNRYQIISHIGKGGMADVYLAYDVILKREVAVKILKSDLADDKVSLERFSREAGAIANLSHPNIVDVYDVGDDGENHYIVMEYIKGYALKQLIKKRGAIPYKESVWMMKQLSGALMEAHKNEIIHRDIKSQNVLIKHDGTVKLSDFGIAIANGDIEITSKDSVIGSVHYLAPELSKGKQASMQSDIYSLGIVFYELLTGDVPFTGDNAIQVALKHIKETIPSVRSINPDIPQSVENIIIRATCKNPKYRYRNISLMLKDLNECLNDDHLYDKKLVLTSDGFIDEKETKTGNERNFSNKILIVVLSLLSVILLLLIMTVSGVFRNRTQNVTVPDIVDKTIQEARDELAVLGIEIDESRIEWILTDSVEKNRIVSVVPEVGSTVEKGSKIKVTVSDGVYSIMGNYVGMDYNTAQDTLKSLNFRIKLVGVQSTSVPGTVLSQSVAPGDKFDSSVNNDITLEYAVEESVILDSSVSGMDISEAASYFEQLGYNYKLVAVAQYSLSTDEQNNFKPYTVVKTDPALGSAFIPGDDNYITIYFYEPDSSPVDTIPADNQ